MNRYVSIQTELPQDRAVFSNTPVQPLHVPRDAVESPPSTEPKLHDPVGRTVSTSQSEDDEWSDENIEKWLERDKLDPALKPWVRATLGE